MEEVLPFERDAGTSTLGGGQEPHHPHHPAAARLAATEPSQLLRDLCAAGGSGEDEEGSGGFEAVLDAVLSAHRRRQMQEQEQDEKKEKEAPREGGNGAGRGEEAAAAVEAGLTEEERKGLEWAEVGYKRELSRAPLLRRLLSAFVHPVRLPPPPPLPLLLPSLPKGSSKGGRPGRGAGRALCGGAGRRRTGGKRKGCR